MCMCKKSVTYENNDSCKQRLVVVLTLHIERNFNLKVFFVFFHFHSLPRSLSAIQKQKIAVIFSLSLLLWATLVENCLVSVQRDCNLKNKRQKLRWDGF